MTRSQSHLQASYLRQSTSRQQYSGISPTQLACRGLCVAVDSRTTHVPLYNHIPHAIPIPQLQRIALHGHLVRTCSISA